MKRLSDQFADDARVCASFGDLKDLLDHAAGKMGFTYFALVHHAAVTSGRPSLLWLHNYPENWVEMIQSEAAVDDDPVHVACRHAVTGFDWTEIEHLAELDRHQRDRLAASHRFGLGNGFTIPIHVPGEPSASCSFAVQTGQSLPKEQLLCSELIGLHAFAAARNLLGETVRPARPHLSPRERSCLKLVARGKTDWEISVILGISVETARQYVKQARHAYDVLTRTQLVVVGLRDDWIDFDQALPPTS